MRNSFLSILLFTCFCSTAQILRTPVGAVYTSLTTYSTQFTDAFAFRSNAASLADVKSFSAGIYSERRFMLEELSSYSFAAVSPTTTGNFGISGDYYGGSLYNETHFGLGYGRTLGDKASVGLRFNYLSVRPSGYGSASAITVDAGATLHLTDAVKAGLSVYNPVGMAIGKNSEERLPSTYAAGLGYDASPQLFIGAEAQKTEDQAVSMNIGLQYLFDDKLTARGGISSATSTYYIGFGVKLKSLRLDATASFHPYLGITPGMLLIYSPQK